MPDSLPRITEAQFLRQVLALAKHCGWTCAHFRPAMNRRGKWQTAVQADGAGFPDLFLLRRRTGHKLVAELKVGRNRTTAEQQRWLSDFELVGVPAFVWTPAEWEEIERVLEHGPEKERV